MTDRVYPSSKPKTTTTTATATTTTTTPNQKLPPPPNKSQFPTTTNRHPYRPNPTTTTTHHHRNRRRSCFCLCCFCSTLILLLLITTIAGCILYLLYHPHRPSFSIAALKTSTFILSTTASDDTTRLTSKLNLTLSASNPNKKITFFYDPFTITLLSHHTLIANGSYPYPITSKPNNITIIHSTLHTTSLLLDPDTVRLITSDLKKKSGLPLKLLLDTEARVNIESLTTKKLGIRIKCEGIHTLIPKTTRRNMTSSAVAATVTAAKCKADLRIKIWKWTF